jgi:hypothetical protein
MTAIAVPDFDVIGDPSGAYTRTRTEWALLIHGPIRGIPGPHLMEPQDGRDARVRLGWWLEHRPDANPQLVRREIVETAGGWETA